MLSIGRISFRWGLGVTQEWRTLRPLDTSSPETLSRTFRRRTFRPVDISFPERFLKEIPPSRHILKDAKIVQITHFQKDKIEIKNNHRPLGSLTPSKKHKRVLLPGSGTF